MPYHGSPNCIGCSGEDCCCCEVWIEEQADQRASIERDPSDLDDEWEETWEDDEDEQDDEPDDSMDGDFDSGMRDAGFGTDEDYNHYDYGDE